jgi:hypothetical protein
MLVDSSVAADSRKTNGYVAHTGRMRVSCKLANGTLVTLVLPDDWQTLLARVAALEAAMPASVPNSIEDLTYGG